jgi:hypothetical protein
MHERNDVGNHATAQVNKSAIGQICRYASHHVTNKWTTNQVGFRNLQSLAFAHYQRPSTSFSTGYSMTKQGSKSPPSTSEDVPSTSMPSFDPYEEPFCFGAGFSTCDAPDQPYFADLSFNPIGNLPGSAHFTGSSPLSTPNGFHNANRIPLVVQVICYLGRIT